MREPNGKVMIQSVAKLWVKSHCELLAKERKINLSERHRSKNSQKKTTVGKELENP